MPGSQSTLVTVLISLLPLSAQAADLAKHLRNRKGKCWPHGKRQPWSLSITKWGINQAQNQTNMVCKPNGDMDDSMAKQKTWARDGNPPISYAQQVLTRPLVASVFGLSSYARHAWLSRHATDFSDLNAWIVSSDDTRWCTLMTNHHFSTETHHVNFRFLGQLPITSHHLRSFVEGPPQLADLASPEWRFQWDWEHIFRMGI